MIFMAFMIGAALIGLVVVAMFVEIKVTDLRNELYGTIQDMYDDIDANFIKRPAPGRYWQNYTIDLKDRVPPVEPVEKEEWKEDPEEEDETDNE